MGGIIPALCLDLPFCYRYQYTSGNDLTWATELPTDVSETIMLAKASAAGMDAQDVMEQMATSAARKAASAAAAGARQLTDAEHRKLLHGGGEEL